MGAVSAGMHGVQRCSRLRRKHFRHRTRVLHQCRPHGAERCIGVGNVRRHFHHACNNHVLCRLVIDRRRYPGREQQYPDGLLQGKAYAVCNIQLLCRKHQPRRQLGQHHPHHRGGRSPCADAGTRRLPVNTHLHVEHRKPRRRRAGDGFLQRRGQPGGGRIR